MELTRRHVDWLLDHLVHRVYGTQDTADLSSRAKDLLMLGYAIREGCDIPGFIFSVGTSLKGKQFLEAEYKIEYINRLIVLKPSAAPECIATLSRKELPEFLTHRFPSVRKAARERMEYLR